MRVTIWGQVFGCLGHSSFGNGLMLLYLTHLGIGSATTLTYLSVPWMLQAALLIPIAYLADRVGKLKLGTPGMVLCTLGFVGIAGAGFLTGTSAWLLALGGIGVYSVGWAMYGASWYALLSPVVPDRMRGRFFGTMRFSWQLASLVFGVACTFVLTKDSPMPVYQGILGLVVAGLLVRGFFYAQIPELEKPNPQGGGLLPRLVAVARVEGYASFCCYVFLITLFTANCPNLFGLVEKKTLNFSDDTVVWMGNLFMFGSITGYFLGGKLVDRWGTKPVFLACHFTFAAVLWAFLVRGLVPAAPPVYLGFLNYAFGAVTAASSVAISTEMLALIPSENKSLSTALCQTLQFAGQAGSGFFSAGAIQIGLFREEWSLFGMALGPYDALLLVFGVLVLVMVVALGLVPSVLRKAEWIPRGT